MIAGESIAGGYPLAVVSASGLPRKHYAVVDGEELPYFQRKTGQWVVWSPRESAGFEPVGDGTFEFFPGLDDCFECVEYVHDATYLGKFVALGGGKGGSVWVWADTGHTNSEWSDAETRAAGFEWQEPGVWRRELRLDDPDLVVVTSRVRVDPPWLKKSEG